MQMDNRGLATGILKFVAGLALFALMYGVLNQIAMQLLTDFGAATSHPDLLSMQSYLESAWVFLPLIVVFMVSVRLLARAAFESRGGV